MTCSVKPCLGLKRNLNTAEDPEPWKQEVILRTARNYAKLGDFDVINSTIYYLLYPSWLSPRQIRDALPATVSRSMDPFSSQATDTTPAQTPHCPKVSVLRARTLSRSGEPSVPTPLWRTHCQLNRFTSVQLSCVLSHGDSMLTTHFQLQRLFFQHTRSPTD
jgi:hypothetical protein